MFYFIYYNRLSHVKDQCIVRACKTTWIIDNHYNIISKSLWKSTAKKKEECLRNNLLRTWMYRESRGRLYSIITAGIYRPKKNNCYIWNDNWIKTNKYRQWNYTWDIGTINTGSTNILYFVCSFAYLSN